MSELLKRTDRLWSGEASTTQAEFHPFAGPRLLEELAPRGVRLLGMDELTPTECSALDDMFRLGDPVQIRWLIVSILFAWAGWRIGRQLLSTTVA